MKKTILVSADRGETRVAVLESKTKGGKRKRRRALHRATRPALDRRQHLQGQGRQRPPRHGGRLRRHRPRAQRLPPRRRDRPARRRTGAEARPRQRSHDRRADQVRPGDHRPGRQGPAEVEGRAALDERLDRRPLPGLRAAGQRRRRQPAADRIRARPAAQDGRSHLQGAGRADRPHRRPRSEEIRLRARDRLPAQAQRGAGAARRADRGAGPRLPGGRPAGARPPRRLPESTSKRRSSTRRSSSNGSPASSSAPRRSWSTGSSSTRATSRCSRNGGSTRRSSRPWSGASTCPPAAT